jgi:hypothetical protein
MSKLTNNVTPHGCREESGFQLLRSEVNDMTGRNHEPYQPTRRGILSMAASAASLVPIGFFCAGLPVSAQTGDQPEWRFCNKCNALFFDGYPEKGHCAAGGPHVAQGFQFSLHYDSNQAGNQRQQYIWRYCEKCHVLFFDGYPAKGHCPAGGGHSAAGLMFGLAFQPQPGMHQTNWRFCNKCNGLFFDGYPAKGSCPAGGGHLAQGLVFNIPYWDASTDIGKAISSGLQSLVEANRPALEQRIQQELGRGDLISKGVTLYDISFHLGTPSFRYNGNRFDYQLVSNRMNFKSTTPTVLGSYADPAFELHFDSALNGSVTIPRGGRPRIDNLAAQIPNISVSPHNVPGSILTTVVHFFQMTEAGGRMIRQEHEKLNLSLTTGLNEYLTRL